MHLVGVYKQRSCLPVRLTKQVEQGLWSNTPNTSLAQPKPIPRTPTSHPNSPTLYNPQASSP